MRLIHHLLVLGRKAMSTSGGYRCSLAGGSSRCLPLSPDIAATRLASSAAFVPNPPPGTHGQPVFPDITNLGESSPEAIHRNQDEDAVFVVTGASRGIGKQIVTSLLDRTKVLL